MKFWDMTAMHGSFDECWHQTSILMKHVTTSACDSSNILNNTTNIDKD